MKLQSVCVWLCVLIGYIRSGTAYSDNKASVSSSGGDEECAVSAWSSWTSCTPLRDCTSSRAFKSAKTVMMKPKKPGTGGVMTEKMMTTKTAFFKDGADCIRGGQCPQDTVRPSGGPQPCVEGLAGDLPCWNVELKSFVNIPDLGYVTKAPNEWRVMGNDCWGWVDPQTLDEYAIVGVSGGTSFVRVTNPEEPLTVGFIHTQTIASIWRDIKVVGNHAFIVSEAPEHGMQIFDLTTLRGVQSLTYFEPTAHYAEFGNAHNIVSNEETGFVYVVGTREWNCAHKYTKHCKGGLHAINVSNPTEPVFMGCFDQDEYTHDAQCVVYRGPDRHYTDREVCFCYNEDSLTIVDVTDKSDMKLISKRGYTSSAYTHQGWLTEDQSTLLMDDEVDEIRGGDDHTKTLVWDVSDLDSPRLMSTYRHALTVIDHNQYIKGDFTYQANYQGGLRILHIDQKNYDLKEVGYLDVYPANDTAEFKGAWNVYPYFPSGNLIISSIDFGLFVVRPDYCKLQEEADTKYVHSERTRVRGVTNSTDGVMCPALRESQMCASVRCDIF